MRLSASLLSWAGLVLTVSLLTLAVVVVAPPPGSPALDRRAQARTTSNATATYGWPVVPFFRQHPVRGLFGDPRIGTTEQKLHFGVDVVAPNGTAVYATLSGQVSLHPLHPGMVMVADGNGRVFEYWHVVPTRTTGWAIAYRTVIGRIEDPWAHVHFAERIGSRYLNPLRPGAMAPYVDSRAPVVERLAFERNGREIGHVLSGRVDVIVEAWDAPPTAVPAPWDRVRLTPALVRWRLIRPGSKGSVAWRVAYDARGSLPSESFSEVFAAETRQNRTNRIGRYRIYVLHRWNAEECAQGWHAIQVSVSDIRGRSTTDVIPFTVANL